MRGAEKERDNVVEGEVVVPVVVVKRFMATDEAENVLADWL